MVQTECTDLEITRPVLYILGPFLSLEPKAQINWHSAKRVRVGSPAGSMEEDDGRREAAIASAPSLQPNFTTKNGVNPAQISKFQELHRRRLKTKTKSKVKDKSKGTLVESEMYNGKDVNAKCKEIIDEKLIKTAKDPRITLSIGSTTDLSSSQEDNTLSKKRQKLHWGLDTKERWERKSNM
ncbi:LOW QUALITY PROTEIN: uncharacterized protein LOC129872725 [Solanum dulcamara]|uniref:LOW QUALITY PROTEIN: uncharacterized protein LOC129872725 n=1 Tax=Solanum dulcamara TaxID=45834 RepID=UPI00248625FF|nr:LOW QUALITY PROTEIN: uncharacterized protein LOC129872725 [Solanum dulcamara]